MNRRVDKTGDGRYCINRSFITLLFTIYHYGYQIKDDEMGRECGTYEGKVYTKLQSYKRHPDVSGDNIKADLTVIKCEGVV
jgi:hypothetical protein